MSFWDWTFAVLAGVGLIELVVFIIGYSMRPWRSNPYGIALMGLASILALMFALIFLGRVLGGLGAIVWSLSLLTFDAIILRWLILLREAQTGAAREGPMKIFGREPTLWLQAISGALAFLVTFGWDRLSAEAAGAIVAVLAAAFGVANALTVRPVAPVVFNTLITTGAALLATYGLDFSQERIGQFQLAVVALMTLLTRVQVTPVTDRDNTAVGVDATNAAPTATGATPTHRMGSAR
jgi:hypothetical protein